MDDGIISIKLCPEWNSPSIRSALESSLSKSTLLQAAVAFLTVSDNLFHNKISPALQHRDAFLCADLHQPTDIDALANLVRSGAHVYLFCEEIATYTDNRRKEPPCLLHPKMLLFWSSDKTAELWVGSHNWTNRAILGLNVEASIVVKMKDSSPLFYEAAEYLNKTRSICEEFDLSKVEFYKELQKSIQESTVPVIEVEASQAHSLAGMEITIFGNDLRDLDELGTFRKEVYLSATENSGNVAEFIYPAEIRQTGALNSANPTAGTLSFSARRHAFRLGRRLPELLPHGAVAQSSLTDARYFVTLELQQSNPLIEFSYPRARKATWEVSEMSNSPLLRRLGVNERTLLFRDRTPRLKVPTVGEEETAYGLTLYERRNLSERNFVTKRVVKER